MTLVAMVCGYIHLDKEPSDSGRRAELILWREDGPHGYANVNWRSEVPGRTLETMGNKCHATVSASQTDWTRAWNRQILFFAMWNWQC